MKIKILTLILIALYIPAFAQEIDSNETIVNMEVNNFINSREVLAFYQSRDNIVSDISSMNMLVDNKGVTAQAFSELEESYRTISDLVNTFVDKFGTDFKTMFSKKTLGGKELQSLGLGYTSYLSYADSVYNNEFKTKFDECCTDEHSQFRFALSDYADAFSERLSKMSSLLSEHSLNSTQKNLVISKVNDYLNKNIHFPAWETVVKTAPEGTVHKEHKAVKITSMQTTVEGKFSVYKIGKTKNTTFKLGHPLKGKITTPLINFCVNKTDLDSAEFNQYGFNIYNTGFATILRYSEQSGSWNIFKTIDKQTKELNLPNLLEETKPYYKWNDKFVILFSNVQIDNTKLSLLISKKITGIAVLNSITEIFGDAVTKSGENMAEPGKLNDNTVSFQNFVTEATIVPLYFQFGKK